MYVCVCVCVGVGVGVGVGGWVGECGCGVCACVRACVYTLFSPMSDVVHSQEYDESGEFCRKSGKTCPDDPAKPYEKYCCIDVYNRVPYPVCCSPYFGYVVIVLVCCFSVCVCVGGCECGCSFA